VQIVSSGLSDVGRVRTNNEDSFRIVEAVNLFILSDGMGGEAHGEVASAMAVDVINKYCESENEDSGATMLDEAPANISSQTRRLKNAVTKANLQIFQSAQKNPEQRGMGATITALWLKDTLLSIAHVGDSRAYLLRNGNLQQLTNDHSLVAEQVRRGLITPQQAEESEMQSVLLRALEPVAGLEQMALNRGLQPDLERTDSFLRQLTSGPSRLCQALGVTRMGHNGLDVTDAGSPLQIWDDGFKASRAMVTPRIGINPANDAVDWPLRFVLPGNACVSGPKNLKGNLISIP